MIVSHQILPPCGQAREALRNKGQFWTPAWVADAMVAYVLSNGSQHLFDPAVGEGAFWRASKQEASRLGRTIRFSGTEIDEDIVRLLHTTASTEDDIAGIEIRDFMFNPPNETYPSIVANPPYIRHHRLTFDAKQSLKTWSSQVLGKCLDGRTGLHTYFFLRALTLLEEGGNLAFILPADVCEGKSAPLLWQWITLNYRIDAVLTFDAHASPFPGVDTNAIIFLLKKAPPVSEFYWVKVQQPWTEDLYTWVKEGLHNRSNEVLTIVKRSLEEGVQTGFSRPPRTHCESYTRLGDFCTVMRGIATGDNDYFFLTRSQADALQIPEAFLFPAVGRTRDVTTAVLTKEHLVQLEQKGRPTLLFAPDSRPKNEFAPPVQEYLCAGEKQNLHEKALLSQRRPWYNMEKRRIPPFLFAYLGRRNIRFIRNEANALPLSSFLCVYPRQNDPQTIECIWRLLQHPLLGENFASVGKSYGSGAIKIEPRALEALPIPQEALQASGLSWLSLF